MSKSNYIRDSKKCIAPESGVSVSEQFPAEAIATVTLDDRPPTEVWGDIATSDAFIDALVRSLRSYGSEMYVDEFREEMRSYDLPGTFDALAVGLAEGSYSALRDFIEYIEGLGTFEHTTTEHVHTAAGLLGLGEETAPTVAVRVTEAFTERRREHRDALLTLVFTLGKGADVKLIANDGVRSFLYHRHGGELPPSVESECNPLRHHTPTDAQLAADLTEASRAIAHSKKLPRILELVAQKPAERLSYTRLADELSIERETVRSHAKALRDAGLATTGQWLGETAVGLTPLGREYIEAREESIGLQSRLNDLVESTGNSCKYSREGPPHGRGEGTTYTDRRRHGTAVNVEAMRRSRAAAVCGAATEGGITLAEWPQAPEEELRQPFWAFDDDRLIVAAEYVNPMQYWVCIARALSSHLTFNMALTPERLDGEIGDLGGLVTDDLYILRNARNLGFLKDENATGERYVDVLKATEDDLLDLTSMLNNVTDGDVNELRGTITKLAHGLAGTIVHLCDLAGIKVIRELRLGEFSRRFSDRKRVDDLLESIGVGVAIQSTLGHFGAYRHLFESRPEKVASAIPPEPPADDPHGRFIGSLVVVGNGVSRLESDLREAVRGEVAGLTLQEDGPEFDVGVHFKTRLGRESYAAGLKTALAAKNLTPTNEAVSLMQAFTASPYDATEAIGNGLEQEDRPRDIRVDEVRTALASLEPERIMPEHSPTVSKTVHALLTAEEPLSQAQLAERAGVSARSIRNNRDILEAFGLVSVEKEGRTYRYRLNVSYRHERGRGEVLPKHVADDLATPTDVLTDAVHALYGTDIYDGHPLGAALFADSPPDAVAEADPSLEPWVEVAIAFGGGKEPEEEPERFGRTPRQAAITGVGA